METKPLPTIQEELKDYDREELIEEIARLRLVVIKRNMEKLKEKRKNE